MKKTLMIAATAVLAAACTKTTTSEVAPQNAIGFNGNFVENATKAIDNATINKMFVFGINNAGETIFDNVAVSKEGASWKYTETRYWQKNTSYKFIAYTNDNETLAGAAQDEFGTYGLNIPGYVADRDNQKDLVVADVVERTIGDKVEANDQTAEIKFNFKHVLSKVRFAVTTAEGVPANVKVKLSDIKIYGMNTTASYENTGWGASSVQMTETNAFAHTFATTEVSAGVKATTDYYYVIPQGFAEDIVIAKFEATLNDGSQDIKTVIFEAKLPAGTWDPNNVYTYTVPVSVDDFNTVNPEDKVIEITFGDPEVEGWHEPENEGSATL